MRRRIRWALLAGLVLCPSISQAVIVNYDASSGMLPSDASVPLAQRFSLIGTASFASLNGGVLKFDDVTTSPSIVFQQLPSFGTDWAYQVRLQTVSHTRAGLDYGPLVGVRDGDRTAVLAVAAGQFGLVDDFGDSWVAGPVTFDSTDGFHTFLVRKEGATVSVSVDGNLLLSAAYTDLDFAAGGTEQVLLAATSTVGTMKWDLTLFSVNTNGATFAVPVPGILGLGLIGLTGAIGLTGLIGVRRPQPMRG